MIFFTCSVDVDASAEHALRSVPHKTMALKRLHKALNRAQAVSWAG